MDPVLENIRQQYYELERRVIRAFHTMAGNATLVEGEKRHVMQFIDVVQQARDRVGLQEFDCITSNLRLMLSALDETSERLSDYPDADTIPVAYRVKSGGPGRPRVEINREVLAEGLLLRGGPGSLALPFGCSSRTIRRRAIEYNLVPPGQPVCTEYENDDHSISRTYTSSTGLVSLLSDEELDQMVHSMLHTFNHFGLRMIAGRLRADGHRVPRSRIRESFIRVNGVPNRFGHREINRQPYNVAGANSLWHHDGQHGLIRYKFVIHCFVDGKSRMVTGIQISNNNRAATVLQLFHQAVENHGCPRRVRGDHGTENIRVAEFMEARHGIGAYIWGRSVHNTRIKRIWYDVTCNFGKKWKTFFQTLEIHEALNIDCSGHAWLLHHLFHFAIEMDAQEWAITWNYHTLRLRNQRDRSPRDIFLFSQLQDGPRGIEMKPVPPEEEVLDPASYGIDWEDLDDRTIQAHFMSRQESEEEFYQTHDDPSIPSNLKHVPVEPPNCPLTAEQVEYLDGILRAEFTGDVRNMDIRRLMWRRALEICLLLVSDTGVP